jgi:two-component system NarL family sensor kinase
VRGSIVPVHVGDATAESERTVAWLRLPAIVLIALGQGLAHPNPEQTGFLVALVLFSAWSASVLAWVYLRPATQELALVTTGIDIAAISVLAVLSGGAFSNARLAFFLVPVAVAFRFRPAFTSAAVVVTTTAYVVQAVVHPAVHQPEAARFILTQAGFLAWVGVACVLLSLILARRTALVEHLAETRSRLLSDALEAEQRERKALADSLHDHALQNILSVRHMLEEIGEHVSDREIALADETLAETVAQLRDAVFDLHPYVLDEAGLESALRSFAGRAAAQARLRLILDLRYPRRHPQEQLVFSAARELISNVVEHAQATELSVALVDEAGELVLVVEDDGGGIPAGRLSESVREGHVGLPAQQHRIEAAGGRLEIASAPGQGTQVSIRLPSPGRQSDGAAAAAAR